VGRKGAGREERETEKGKEGIGEEEGGERELGSPTHYSRLESCTVLNYKPSASPCTKTTQYGQELSVNLFSKAG